MELKELIAFNDEVVALSRAGIPIGEGLMHSGQNLPRRLGKVTDRVSELMQQGQSLESAFDALPDDFPPLYRAVVRTGIRSGRLASACECLASSLRRIAELRTVIVNSLYYPLFVVCCALLLFSFLSGRILWQLQSTITGHRLRNLEAVSWWLEFAGRFGNWLTIVPIAVVGTALLWWWKTGRARTARLAPNATGFGWIPGARRLLRYSQRAMFADLLSTLVAHNVPLPEALPLAANATGGEALMTDAAELADRIDAGNHAPWQSKNPNGIPPLVSWLVSNQSGTTDLSTALQQMARSYFQKAQDRTDWLQSTLPSLATAGIAGTATFAYVSSFLIPWLTILSRLSQSIP